MTGSPRWPITRFSDRRRSSIGTNGQPVLETAPPYAVPTSARNPRGVKGGRSPPLPVRNVQRCVCWLAHLSGVRQTRRRRVPDASSAAANTVAAHHRNRSGEPVQTGLPKRGQRWDGGQRCRAIHVPPKPERRLIPPMRLSMGTGTGSDVGWINLTTCVSSGVSPRLIALPFTLR